MSAFEKVIGYESIKNELMQICDMVHNKERYKSLGARMPCGVLLHGDPGIGKTLMAKCFIEECGINRYTLRSNKGTDKFVDEITEVFEKAKKNSPSIIFLDDMDKFANDDEKHRDAKEYVAVQAGIDSVKECDVFVIATTNDICKLPQSLIRPGRFDKTIIMKPPTREDAKKIIKHYLNNKKLSMDVNFDDLCNMISYHSCADLETIINEAAISAGFAEKESIDMDDLINAVLRLQYDSPDDFFQRDENEIRKVALHEAGHLVVSEVIKPGCVGLASVRTRGRSNTGGFIHKCDELKRSSHIVMGLLGGKVATELYYSDTCASGCWSDLKRVIDIVRDDISVIGTHGIGMIDTANYKFLNLPNHLIQEMKQLFRLKLNDIYSKREIFFCKTKNFLKKLPMLLQKKKHCFFQILKQFVKVLL